MIFVTGDIHADPSRLSSSNFPLGKTLTKEDFVIILGDFGLIWSHDGESKDETYWLDWLDNKPWTTLFIDGNHENHERLNAYPINDWNGGKVQKIRPSVIHLMRGEVFTLQDYKFLAFGGNYSHDITDGVLEITDPRIKSWTHDRTKLFRVNHYSWWKEEVPNDEERENCIRNLAKNYNKVDFVLTHCLPSSAARLLYRYMKPEINELENWMESNIHQKVEYTRLYSGHYHMNRAITDREILLYEDIIRIV